MQLITLPMKGQTLSFYHSHYKAFLLRPENVPFRYLTANSQVSGPFCLDLWYSILVTEIRPLDLINNCWLDSCTLCGLLVLTPVVTLSVIVYQVNHYLKINFGSNFVHRDAFSPVRKK